MFLFRIFCTLLHSFILFQVSNKRVQQWCQNKGGIPFIETSAKDAYNVEKLFETVCRDALAREAETSEMFNEFPDQIRLTSLDEPPREGCSC
jgi:Ras-related protein Rab-7A